MKMMNILQTILDEICLLLESYKGRDKVRLFLCASQKYITSCFVDIKNLMLHYKVNRGIT